MTKRDDDAGFTLIELIISVAILVIIGGALYTAFGMLLANTDATNGRLAESHDAQIATAYFAKDVQSMGVRNSADPPALIQSVEVDGPAAGGVFACGGVAAKLRIAWDEYSLNGATPPSEIKARLVAAYSIQTAASGDRQLRRRLCRDGTVVSDAVIVHHLASADPSVTCATACAAASPPATITLSVTVAHKTNPGGYQFQLHGERRQT